MKTLVSFWLLILTVTIPNMAGAQHLWWSAQADGKPIEKMTFLYGEIEVLASGPTIYYCGVNWQPGRPAGGYCGIQDHGGERDCVIFSVWDTSQELHPHVAQAEERTSHGRFGGEGEGSHTHLNYKWEKGKVFKFAVTKQQDKSDQNTLAAFYFYDEKLKKWVHEATISSPTDGKDCVRYFGGSMNSFLENWSGKQREVPKLCLYRLWAGTAPDNLKFLRKGKGDGHWGALNGSYYLAGGDDAALDAIIAKQPKSEDNVIRAKRRQQVPLIPRRTLPPKTVKALQSLPKSKAVSTNVSN